MPSPFTFAKISDYGTSTPVVARTVHQAHLLLNVFPVSEEFRHRVTEVMWEIQRHLLECHKTCEAICQEARQGQAEFAKRVAAGGDPRSVPTLPWVMDLDSRLESFLHSAKLALRDTGAILDLFFSQNFGHRFDRALRWAKKQFGENDPLVLVIAAYNNWVKEIIDMRNAVEHPSDDPRGRLQVQNFALKRERGGFVLVEPHWQLTGDPSSSVAADLPVIVDYLLRLSEEVYVCSLMKMKTPIVVEIVEIPEPERDSTAPVRFRSTGYMPVSGA